ncbi:MAG: type 1 glutamine amidotransferase domain-containing protein [Phycisphaeraceae bacterium]
MSDELIGRKIAILVDEGFEQIELTSPREALEKQGAITHIVSPGKEKVRGRNHDKPGDEFDVDVPLDAANPDDYDVLVLPGGVMNPDKLRQNDKAVAFTRAFFDQNKPVAAICHGPWTLIEAGVVRGRRMTSYPSLKTDLGNAGAEWVDEPVVLDGALITSRGPQDLDAFNAALIRFAGQGRQAA